ncbi:MFS transporter [Clostridium acetobutylicum]|nr:MFS transporter [Clostridium acetobutylicum]
MFKEMRRKERELSFKETEKILKSCEYGVLSTIGENGYPYGVPISYVYLNGFIYFHSATEGHKLENIENNPKLCFSIVGKTSVLPDKFTTNYESVVVFGTAEEVFNEEKNEVLLEVLKKYSSSYIEKGKVYINASSIKTRVIKINIDYISGKSRK